ncbi:proline-rich protein PRCC [Caerostris extrusa]|uniref:Proline-rich protein PRCC n=1 Tax=Caerostris extrusa TaxID=172846 RepID=A0AAV4QXZ3_CAEEX|nr:proline-rich protein PRCC [Caerostris extrusa]
MSLVAYGSSDSEEESEEQTISKINPIIKPSQKKQRETVKITIPSLEEFKEEDLENESKIKPKIKSGSGLLSMLPPPKYSGSSITSNFTPHVLTKQKNSKKNSAEIKQVLKVSKATEDIKVTDTSKVVPTFIDVSIEDDNNDSSAVDYFFLESNNNKRVTEQETSVLDSEISKKDSLFSSLPEPIRSTQFYNVEPISHHADVSSFASIPNSSAQISSNVLEKYNIHENHQNTSSQIDSEVPLMNDKEFKKILGGRKMENINFIDVKGDDQITGKDEWLMQSLTEERVQRPSKRRHDMPTTQQKRKHQITYLAFQAKERELDLKNQWASNRQTKRETQAKYGF